MSDDNKYSNYTEEQIDQLIDLRVEREKQEWLKNIADTLLQNNVKLAREKAEKAGLEAANYTTPLIKLREIALEESIATPTIATDEEMEKLIQA